MRLHVICLDAPYPDNYGGAIDMYHKLRALHTAGIQVVLHVYLYNGSMPVPELEHVAEEVHYYNRTVGWRKQFTLKPYIVNSRDDKRLLENLSRDDSPIFFEGIQSCYLLDNPRLANRLKIVRMHNVEHEYYRLLAKSMPFGIPKLFHYIESYRLKLYEHTLCHANYILPITKADTEYYKKVLPDTKVQHLNCFFDDSYPTEIRDIRNSSAEPYIFYHGNLFLTENNRVAHFLISEVLPRLDVKKHRLVIAGRKPPQWLIDEAHNTEGVTIIADPSHDEMSGLLANASVNVLITFQPTGIKLKLLNALTHSYGHCVANREMLHSTSLETLCIEADTAEGIADAITQHFGKSITEEEMQRRRSHIAACGYNNAASIIDIISENNKKQ